MSSRLTTTPWYNWPKKPLVYVDLVENPGNANGKEAFSKIGALQKIRSCDIEVVPKIKKFSKGLVQLVNGQELEINSVVLATRYCSNVPYWLQVDPDGDNEGGSKKSVIKFLTEPVIREIEHIYRRTEKSDTKNI